MFVARLWVDSDDSDSFAYPVFGNYDSGAGCAWFGYFFDDFKACHAHFDGFLGDCFLFWHTNNHCNNIAIVLMSFAHTFTAIILPLSKTLKQTKRRAKYTRNSFANNICWSVAKKPCVLSKN